MREWWLRLSLRVRLAIWYAVTSTIILLALGCMLLFEVRGRLLSQLDHQLREDFETVESSVVRDSTGILRWLGDAHKEEEETTNAEDQAGLWFEILAPAGSVLLHAGPATGLKTPPSSKHGEGSYVAFSTEIEGRFPARVLQNNTEIAGDPVFLRVLRPEAGVQHVIAELGAVLGFGLPVAGALSAIGGYLIAHRSLSPVSQIAARAREITANSLEGRLPVPNPHDEVGQLATVFNATLGRLENSFAELRRFTADASHELRTPLTALRAVGEAALRSDNGDAKSLREALYSMLEETRRLTDLVDALLLLARADTNVIGISLRQIDLAQLANEVRETLLVLAEEKNQRIEITAERLAIWADRELLRLALLNLIHNAIRYGGEATVIGLQIRSQDKTALVEVKDQGPGIAPADHQKIFERFYRIDKARSRGSGGVGLGLSIARWAVERQGGHIELESELNRGSLFRIVMPHSVDLPAQH